MQRAVHNRSQHLHYFSHETKYTLTFGRCKLLFYQTFLMGKWVPYLRSEPSKFTPKKRAESQFTANLKISRSSPCWIPWCTENNPPLPGLKLCRDLRYIHPESLLFWPPEPAHPLSSRASVWLVDRMYKWRRFATYSHMMMLPFLSAVTSGLHVQANLRHSMYKLTQD